MRAKAKSSSTPYPIWVEGEYITEPPIRPSDGAVRPAGHYIDKGGYPGANVYEVDINTMCRQTDAADRFGKPIYEQDILLYETAEEIGYFIVQDLETTVTLKEPPKKKTEVQVTRKQTRRRGNRSGGIA